MPATILDRLKFWRKLYKREEVLYLATQIEHDTVVIESVHEMIDSIKKHGVSVKLMTHIDECMKDMKKDDIERDKTKLALLFARLLGS